MHILLEDFFDEGIFVYFSVASDDLQRELTSAANNDTVTGVFVEGAGEAKSVG